MDTDTLKINSNPFVGPYAFTKENKLYGRDREAEKLFNILIACRIVVLFSCSGAGKTSLIQAKLCPMLEKDNFHVLPVVRIGNETTGQGNRYIQSLVQTLEDAVYNEQKPDENKIPPMNLSEYFGKKFTEYDNEPSNHIKDKALIIDQFEEIFTRDQTDYSAKKKFFTELGEGLSEHRNLWVLFAMREEYIAELDRYVHLIPSGFKNTFRLELLEEDAARLAIREPIIEKGVTITDNAVNKLIKELRKIHVYDPYTGTSIERTVPYIEPLILQLSCQRLWNKKKQLETISEEDMVSSEYIDQALTEYYNEKVLETATATDTDENEIRSWCERNLIAHNNTRNMMMKGRHRTAGILNSVVEQLENCHFIRSHKRSGQTWYELIHDRFIDPIIKSNTMVKFQLTGVIKSEKDLDEWLAKKAYYLCNDRRWAKIQTMPSQELIGLIVSSYEERNHDFNCAKILFGCQILTNDLNLIQFDEELIYSHLQGIWLSEIKELKAFYKSTEPHASKDMITNYYNACDEIRQQLKKASIKAPQEKFKKIEKYLTDHYLNKGKIDFDKKETKELIAKKCDRIKEKTGALNEDDYKLAAATYVEMFYENIIPAATKQETDRILMVLKAFHFSEADEHQYHIISGFEAALAIYFLNPDKIISLWEESDKNKIDSFSARVPISNWPKNFTIPRECNGKFSNTDFEIIFKGVMNEEQKSALKEKVNTENHKHYIDQLFEKSRLLPRDKTL